MNMIPGVVQGDGSIGFGDAAALSLPRGTRAEQGREVLYGVRPEHCALGATGLPVEVVVVEPTGADTQLYCRFNGQELTSLVRDRVTCRAGDRISLNPDLARAHLFDSAGGARLTA